MTQEQVNLIAAKAKTDAGFRTALRTNATQTLAGYDLTQQERADLLARNLGAEPAAVAKARAGKGPTPMESFKSKAHVVGKQSDGTTDKWVDNETGREVSPPPDPDAKPGGTLGGRPVAGPGA